MKTGTSFGLHLKMSEDVFCSQDKAHSMITEDVLDSSDFHFVSFFDFWTASAWYIKSGCPLYNSPMGGGCQEDLLKLLIES